MIRRLFTRRQTSILSAAFVIASMVAASRLLGLIRSRLLTARFTPSELDPYFAAFRLPNFVFEILIAGAISVAFIPVFTSYLSKRKREEAYVVAASVMNLAILVVSYFSFLFFLFAPFIVRLIAPGFSESDHVLMSSFTRIILLFQVLPLVIGNFLTGILQSYKRFLIPALAPVVYNIGIIIGIIFLTPTFGLFGAIYGVVLGGVLFFLIQLPFIREIGYRHRWVLDIKLSGVRQIGKLMLPRTISVAATQIDATIDLILASLVGAGSVTIFTLAQQLQLVPLALFGLPVAQAALPTFSEYAAKNNMKAFKYSLLTSLHQILFFVLPASALLIILKVPIIRLVYGADQFDWPATVLTSRTLAAFGISLFAQAIVVLLSRAFFALHDSKTPVVIAIFSIAINSVLSILFILILHLPIWALGLSTSFASSVHALFLLLALDRRVGTFDRKKLIIPFIKISVMALIMGVSLYVPLKLLDQLVFDTTRTLNLFLLTGTATCIGLATYLFFSWFFNVEEVLIFYKFAKKLTKVKDIFFESSKEVVEERVH